MQELKVTKLDNNLGVILPREITEKMNLKEGSPLFLVETPDGNLELMAQNPTLAAKLKRQKRLWIVTQKHSTHLQNDRTYLGRKVNCACDSSTTN